MTAGPWTGRRLGLVALAAVGGSLLAVIVASYWSEPRRQHRCVLRCARWPSPSSRCWRPPSARYGLTDSAPLLNARGRGLLSAVMEVRMILLGAIAWALDDRLETA